MTTVTLPREVVEYLALYFESNGDSSDESATAATLRAALDAPAAPTPAMIAAGVAAMYTGAWETDAEEVEAILKAALGAPQAEEDDPMGSYADANRPSYAEKFGEPDAPQAVPTPALVLDAVLSDKDITALHAYLQGLPALKPQAVDCRGCAHFGRWLDSDCCTQFCTNGDKFQALPIVQLYRKTV